jgi:hypothetical protein
MADFSKMNYKELIQQSKELRAEEEARLAILRETNNVSAQELQDYKILRSSRRMPLNI